MPATYPTTVKAFTTKVDLTDVNFAAHVNELQDEVVALETFLGTNPHISAARNATYATVDARLESLEGAVSYTTHGHDHNALTNLTTGDPHTQYLLKSLGLAKGDLIGFSASGVPVRISISANNSVLTADSAESAGVRWIIPTTPTKTIRTRHTWSFDGSVTTGPVPGFYVSLPAGQTSTLVLARHAISSGTSATVTVRRNGVSVTGLTSIAVSTTATTTDPADVALADGDYIDIDITAVNGAVDLRFTVFLDDVV